MSDKDTIYRQDAVDEIEFELEMINLALDSTTLDFNARERLRQRRGEAREILNSIQQLPSAQPTLYGYNIEHLELIARVLQKENLPPERVAEALTDIGRIVAIVKDEFEESLRKAVDNVQVNLPTGCD